MKKLLFITFGFLISAIILSTNTSAQVVYDNNAVSQAYTSAANTITINNLSIPANDNVVLVLSIYGAAVSVGSINFDGTLHTTGNIGMADNISQHITFWLMPLGDIGTAMNNKTITINFNSNSFGWAATAATFHNVNQSTHNFTDNTGYSIDVTSSAGDMVIDAIVVEGNQSGDIPNLSAGNGQTVIGGHIAAGGNYNQSLSTSYELSTNALTTMSWTNTGDPIFTSSRTHAAFNLTSAGVLPVELIYFKGQATTEGNLLQWQTATEENNYGFNLERSTDGKNWETISFVEGNGTTIETKNYDYTDENQLSGINYYRLKQTDFDGAFEYSDIINIQISGDEKEITIFPNPVKDKLTIQATENINRITIYNSLGQLMKQVVIENNNDSFEMNLSELQEGVYSIQLQGTNGKMRTKQLIKYN